MIESAPTRIRIPNGFTPRWYQRNYMRHFDQGGMEAMEVWHRRSGKDLNALHQECKQAHRRKGVYWHIFPTMEQGRKAIWEGFTASGERIMEQVFPKAIRKYPREWAPNGEMVVELRYGSIWRLTGSDRMETVGAGPCHVTFSEFALAKPSALPYIRPMLRESRGTLALITTPRGRNHAFSTWKAMQANPKAHTSLLSIFETGAFEDPQAVIDAERAAGMPESLIAQEYLCDFAAANTGAIYGELITVAEREGRVEVDFEFDEQAVYAVFDLGIDDSTAIWFFTVGDGIDFVDYYESHNQPLSHYWDVMESKGYRYRKVFLPHDARARSLQTGVSILDQALRRWPGLVVIVPDLSLADGIQAGRWLMQQPKTRFHTRCKEGVETLRQYHYKYDEDAKVYSSKPEHDWASHGSDGYRYGAVVSRVAGIWKPKPAPPPGPVAVPADKSFTLDQLWELNERPGRERI